MTFERAELDYADWGRPNWYGGGPVSVDDPVAVARLAAFFPGAFGTERSTTAGGWLPTYVVRFVAADGSVVKVRVKDDARWYTGVGGDWPVRVPGFAALVEPLFRAAERRRPPTRYHRQTLLPQVGPAGERGLGRARVLLVGCGALGTTVADQLVRAGVGFLRIVDRDVVELTNLQRQVLYDEADAAAGTPKAVAAARRLAAVNSGVTVEPVVADVHAGNIEALARLGDAAEAEDKAAGAVTSRVHLILDGTDNAEARYLINDVSAKHFVPWVYGACVGTEGRVMAVRPGDTPCLRCVFPEPPAPGELATCDTAGVLGPAAAVVGATQAAAAIRLLLGGGDGGGGRAVEQLIHFDLWRGRFRSTSLADARRPDCPACGLRRFDFLDAPAGPGGGSTSLCGRNAVQVRPASAARLDLVALAARLTAAGAAVQRTPHLLKCALPGGAGPGPDPGNALTVFPDGRAIVHGTSDPARARTLYARWVGG